MSIEHGDPSAADRRAGCLGTVILGGLIWGAIYLPDMPARIKRVWEGSDRSEETSPDHTTPPLSEVPCTYEGDTELNFRQKEFAAGLTRRHDEPRGAIGQCEGGLDVVGNPTSPGGPLEVYEDCRVLEPAWDAGIEMPTGEYILICYPKRAA